MPWRETECSTCTSFAPLYVIFLYLLFKQVYTGESLAYCNNFKRRFFISFQNRDCCVFHRTYIISVNFDTFHSLRRTFQFQRKYLTMRLPFLAIKPCDRRIVDKSILSIVLPFFKYFISAKDSLNNKKSFHLTNYFLKLSDTLQFLIHLRLHFN